MDESSLYMTECDVHSSYPEPLSGKELRAYIILNSLFFKRVIISDSSINNNPYLRPLIWDKEESPFLIEDCPRDLALLMKEGYLIPAIRKNYSGLSELRTEHAQRKVEHVPSEGYVAFIEEVLNHQRINYDVTQVGKLFRDNVLKAFSANDDNKLNDAEGKLTSHTKELIFEYVSNHVPFLYNSLRQWISDQIKEGQMTNDESKLIDKIVSICYIPNVGRSLNTNIDAPISPNRYNYPFNVTFGDKHVISINEENNIHWDIPTTIPLSVEFLSTFPAEAILQIKGANGSIPSMNYRKVIRDLETFRRDGEINKTEDLAESLHLYFAEIDNIYRDYLPSTSKGKYMENKNKEVNKAFLYFFTDVGISLLGIFSIVLTAMGIFSTTRGSLNNLQESLRQKKFLKGYIQGRLSEEDQDPHIAKYKDLFNNK